MSSAVSCLIKGASSIWEAWVMAWEPLLPLAWLFSLRMHRGAECFRSAGPCAVQPRVRPAGLGQHAPTAPFPQRSDSACAAIRTGRCSGSRRHQVLTRAFGFQARRCSRMTSSPATSLDSCSCFVKDITVVSGLHWLVRGQQLSGAKSFRSGSHIPCDQLLTSGQQFVHS